MHCLPNFAWKSGNRIFVWYIESVLNTCSNSA
jgi:hypothetical protein